MSSELDRGKNRRKSPTPMQRLRGAVSSSLEFINCELSAEEIISYRKWRENGETVLALLDEACEDGYKVSIKYDDYSSAFACFLFPPDDSDNVGYCLTGRAGTGYRALAEALYKHVVIFGKQWQNTRRAIGSVDDPDF